MALLVLFVALFLSRRQIGAMLARQLDQRLSAAGVFVDWRSADWVPGPGIQLHDLALYRDVAKHDRLALFGNVTAIKGEPGWSRWDRLSVKMTNSRLTLGSGEGKMKLEHMDMHLWIQPGKTELQDCHASFQGLRIEVKGAYAPGAAAAPAKTNAARNRAAPNAGLFADADLGWLKFVKEWMMFKLEKEEPVLKLEFDSLPDGSGMSVAATLDGKMFQWRGQKWDFLQAVVKTSVGDKPSPVEFDHVRLGHAGQTGEIAGSFDPARDVLRISRLDSGLDVLAITRAFAPDAAGSLSGITSTGGWRIRGEGEMPLEHPGSGRWNGSLALDGDLVYAVDGTQLALQKPSWELRMEKQVLSLSGFKTGLWGGNLEAPMTRIRLPSKETKPLFETQLALNGARLQSVMKSFGAAQTQPGVVQLDWKGGGGFELASIAGSGALAIRDAEFYRIPLLGPLHLVFDKLTPGFARDVASTLTAGHRLGGGILSIDNLKLESRLTRIEARGTVDLNRQYARLTAQAKLQGIVGIATSVLSALLEMEGEGPTSNVQWRLKNPGLGMIGDAANVAGKAGGAVIEGAGNAVKGTGKAAKGLLKIPGKLLPGRQQ